MTEDHEVAGSIPAHPIRDATLPVVYLFCFCSLLYVYLFSLTQSRGLRFRLRHAVMVRCLKSTLVAKALTISINPLTR